MNVIIRYTLKDDASLDEVRTAIEGFVSNMKALDANIDYTSFRAQDARAFTHVGRFASKEVVGRLQSQPWFGEFSSFLESRCAEGPRATFMDVVASTRS